MGSGRTSRRNKKEKSVTGLHRGIRGIASRSKKNRKGAESGISVVVPGSFVLVFDLFFLDTGVASHGYRSCRLPMRKQQHLHFGDAALSSFFSIFFFFVSAGARLSNLGLLLHPVLSLRPSCLS